MKVSVTPKQWEFVHATATEVLFGGAAGGGKSYGQLVDALQYAVTYPKSKQLILRRTFSDLERSLIRTSLELFPRGYAVYHGTHHRWQFANGSLVEFGFCNQEKDVYRYQGAEYDTIRFDELTHFTQQMYRYLISRLRGANDYPKQIKSTANPGGVGHHWVKERFVDMGQAGEVHTLEGATRQFIPSKVQDNPYLMEKDPDYCKRLENLAENDRKALLYGDWDIYEGQFFTEFDRSVHLCSPFVIPHYWRRYLTLDYGLDMLACYWIAVSETGNAYVYRELYESNLIISCAAKKILEHTGEEKIYAALAPPDLWNRRQETGKSAVDIFAENGLRLVKTGNSRVDGWLCVKEWLQKQTGEQGEITAKLQIFPQCNNLLRTLPALQHDPLNPNDVANTPHELTHGPDAIRGFCCFPLIRGERLAQKQVDIREIFGVQQKNDPRKGEGKSDVI